VLADFVIPSGGAFVKYAKGEFIEADDPILRTWPDKFGPIVYPHPIKRRVMRTAATTEVRAD
jgi:hypothetical protein